jgi:hypothetical protein
MRRFLFIPVCFVALLIPGVVLAGGGEGGFDGVVRTIETRYHVRVTKIPFIGLVSFVSRRATHGGVSNLHVAEFEHFSSAIDGDELNQLVETKLGARWERIIRETSRNGTSQTLIFIHPEGERMGMFVLDADGSELDVVQVSVDPTHLSENINRYEHHRRDDMDDEDADGQGASN